MIGTVKYSASWTMDELARTCTENENWSFAQLSSLHSIEPAANLATFVKSGSLEGLNDLVVVAKGSKPTANGTYLFTATVYVSDTKTDVDVYRLN